MSIQKIAQLAGVSVATVSRVLNNSDVAKAKNERVLQAIQESNYQPNLLARQLRTARSYMILAGDGLEHRQPVLRRSGEGH